MKFIPILIVTWGCLFGNLNAFTIHQRQELNVTAPPDCSLPCLVSVVPQYCTSLVDLICICTNEDLAVELTGCAMSACNVTDLLRLQNYKAQSCGIENDKSHQDQDMRLHVVLTPLVGLFILARIFIRLRLESGLGADDWAMIGAVVFYMGSASIAFPITIMGYGQHTYYLPIDTITLSLKFFYISEFFYGLTLTLTKVSLLLFYRRIFPNRSMQIGTIVVGSFVILSNLAVIVTMLAQCHPVEGNWTNWMYFEPPIKCIDSFALIVFFASISIFHDLIILIMPLPILLGLNLHWKRKAHALVMFSVGVFVIIASCLRLPVLFRMKTTMDPSYDQAPVALWSYLEQAVGIICGCLPAFRSLISYLFPNLSMSQSGSSAKNGSKSGSYGSATRTYRSGDSTQKPDIELVKRGTSQEQIVYIGNSSSDEIDGRPPPADNNGAKYWRR